MEASAKMPTGKGLGMQERLKIHGGRWNNDDRRIDRTVVYLGIDRIVPHAEKSVSKSYRYLFKAGNQHGWERKFALSWAYS